MAKFSALIALDGTAHSEEALNFLPFLKSIGVETVRLIGVWEEIEGFAGTGEEKFRDTNEKGHALLKSYLEAKSKNLAGVGIEIEPVVGLGAPAAELLRAAEATDTTLVVTATHGRTGIDRWRLGSVADKIIRGTSCPTLVIGPNVSADLHDYNLKRIMVPLDGSELSQDSLPAAISLANSTRATVELVQVVNMPTSWMADGVGYVNVPELMDSLDEGATVHLRNTEVPGLTVERVVLRTMMAGSVATTLCDHLEEKPADLVVMASHGRHGVMRSALGSVADELLRGPTPVLILHPGGKDLTQFIH